MDDYIAMVNERSQKYGISFELAELAGYAFWDNSSPLSDYITKKLGSAISLKDCFEYVAMASKEEIKTMLVLYAVGLGWTVFPDKMMGYSPEQQEKATVHMKLEPLPLNRKIE